MLPFLLQWLRDLFSALLSSDPPIPHPTEIPPLTSEGYETLFLQLTEGVACGWQRSQLLDRLGVRQHDPWFVAWLQRYGKNLLRQSPQSLNRNFAEQMVRLGNLGCGELGEISASLGRRLLAMGDRQAQTQSAPTPLAQTLESDNPLELFDYGVNLYKLGELEGALSLWRNALEHQPNFSEAHNACGVVHYALRQWPEALGCFDQVTVAEPDFSLGYFNRGHVYLELAQLEAAIADFTAVIRQDPDLHYYSYLRRGLAHLHRGQSTEALADFNQAIALQPTLPEGYQGRGMVHYALSDPEAAIAAFTTALNADPNSHDAYHHRALAWQALGRYRTAIEDFTEAILLHPNFYQAYYNRGNSYLELGDWGKAIANYKEALALKPGYVLAHNGRGVALTALGQYEAALKDFQTALELEPDFWPAWANRGWTMYASPSLGPTVALQNWETALNELQQTQRERALALGTLAHYSGLAFAQVAQNQPTQARPLLERAIAAFQRSLEWLQDQPGLETTYLQVITDLIVSYQRTGSILNTKNNLNIALLILNQLQLNSQSLAQKRHLLHQFRGLYQLKVEQLSQALDPKQRLQSLELAEERKNLLIESQLNPHWTGQAIPSPNAVQMNRLLNPETAMIHWQISPASITVFILLQDQPPILLSGHYDQRLGLQRWWERWSKQWETHRQRSGNPEENQQWFHDLWPQLAELAKLLDIASILDRLPPEIVQLILVPHQELHLLPLHLAINHPQFDHPPYEIAYLPSVQIGLDLVDPDQSPGKSGELPLLTVAGTGSELGAVGLEVTVVQQYFASRPLEPGQGTRSQVLAALEEPVQIFHFAGESFWNGTLAAESGLRLGDGTILSLTDLQGLTTPVPALVCLSGHSLHFPADFELELEGLALPTFFLKRGTMDVVVSLWPGTEGSTMLLMGRFYEALKQSTTPAIALSQAQQWLKTLTYGQLLQHYNQLLSHLQDASPRCLEQLKLARDLTQEKAQRQGESFSPYEHPYYWGGFILLGLPY